MRARASFRDESAMYYRRSSLAPPARTTKLGMTSHDGSRRDV